MKNDIGDALVELRPGAQWGVRGNTYAGIEWLDESQTKPTETEVNNKIAALDAAEPMKLLRKERDRRIALTDWRASSDLTLASAWSTYRQALRDLPSSATPDLDGPFVKNVTWPTKP